MKDISILIADNSSTINQHLKSLIEDLGLTVFIASDGDECLRMIQTQKPKLVLVDLFLAKQNALNILQNLKSQNLPDNEKPKILILSNQAVVQNIKECMKWGASDYLLKPLEPEDIISRIAFHLQPSRNEMDAPDKNNTSQLYLHLVDLILQQLNQSQMGSETLFKLMQMTAMTLKSVRASIIEKKPQRVGIVKASSDDPKGNEWTLDLRKYPEILYVLNSGKTLVIDNLENDPTLHQIKKFFSSIQFNSMVVIPLFMGGDEAMGVLSIRMPSNRQKISDDELRFAQIIAKSSTLCLRLHNGGVTPTNSTEDAL